MNSRYKGDVSNGLKLAVAWILSYCYLSMIVPRYRYSYSDLYMSVCIYYNL